MATRSVFKRKIYDRMLQWKQERDGKTALLIKGARRVGKSTIVEEFAKNEYESYILIDFSSVSDEVISLFNDLMNLDYIFLRLQAIFNVVLIERRSVIVFDEVQKCPMARQAIKHLVKDHRYDYIETGSLISIRKNTESIIIPSEETRIALWIMKNFGGQQETRQLFHCCASSLTNRCPLDRHYANVCVISGYICL